MAAPTDPKRPDHTIASAKVKAGAEPPRVYAVANLRAYLKPTMDEELTSPEGGAANLGTALVCACVPVENCVCDTVQHHQGGSGCPDHCSTCVGGLYWFPY